MKRVRWSRAAKHDLTKIDDYLTTIDIDLANAFGNTVLKACTFLLQTPHAGSTTDLDTRKWRVRGSSYLLLYRLSDSGIEILRVRHDRENWHTP